MLRSTDEYSFMCYGYIRGWMEAIVGGTYGWRHDHKINNVEPDPTNLYFDDRVTIEDIVMASQKYLKAHPELEKKKQEANLVLYAACLEAGLLHKGK